MSELSPTPEHLQDPYVIQLIEALSMQQDEIEDLKHDIARYMDHTNKAESEVDRLSSENRIAFMAGFWACEAICEPSTTVTRSDRVDAWERYSVSDRRDEPCQHEWFSIPGMREEFDYFHCNKCGNGKRELKSPAQTQQERK